MADDLATDALARRDEIAALREQLRSSYSKAGLSDETRLILAEYVDKAVQDSGVPALASTLAERDFVEDIAGSIELGVSDQGIFEAIERQLAALASGRHVAGGGPSQRNVKKEADPVEMFTGQFVQEIADAVIDGAGIEFAFRRVYKHQAVYVGTLGAKWDHAYNLFLREDDDGIFRSTGELRMDRYMKHPRFGQAGFNYWVPPDGQHGVLEEHGTSFVWRSSTGERFLYENDSAHPLTHRIERIEDRFGNYLSFRYQDDLIDRVEINHPARFVVFSHDSQRRITAVMDHVGRKWTYKYDDFGDLVQVISPVTDEYPQGLTTTYEYSSTAYGERLSHNLLRIIDPAGRLYLENEYSTDAGTFAFNRLVRQRQGGGEFLFEYESVVEEFEFDYSDSERPAVQVNQVLRHGQLVHFVYNRLGNLLLREEYVYEGDARRLIQWRFRYNRDGALTGSISPEGIITQYHYGRDDYLLVHDIDDEEVAEHEALTAVARLTFGNLLAVIRRGRPYSLSEMNLSRGAWGDFFPNAVGAVDSTDIIVKTTYELEFQQPLTVSDPRFTARADPRFVESAAYYQHLTRYVYAAPPGRPLERVRFPDTTFPAPMPDGTTGLSQVEERYVEYDARGRLLRYEDTSGSATEHQYFIGSSTDPKDGYLARVVRDADGLYLTTSYEVNDVGIRTSIVNGRGIPTTFFVNAFNQTIQIDAPLGSRTRRFFDENDLLCREERDNRDDEGRAAPEGPETRIYEYDQQNNLILESIGGTERRSHYCIRHKYDESDRRVETKRPRGNRTRVTYDGRSLPKKTTRGFQSPNASTTSVTYDGDGRKVVVRDGRGNATRFEYDVFNRVTSRTDSLGNVAQWEHDKLGGVTLARSFERLSDGTFRLLTRSTFEHDERGSRVRRTDYLFQRPIVTADIRQAPDREFESAVAQGRVSPLETVYFYDRDIRLVRLVNANGQDTTYEYDGIGRRITERDVDGNVVRTAYDENSNVIRIDRHEIVRDVTTGAPVREDVFSTIRVYDTLDRCTLMIDGLGNRTSFTYDSRDHLASATDPLGRVVRYQYDVYGRKIADQAQLTDDGLSDGAPVAAVLTQFGYDPNDNLSQITDQLGNATLFEYDELDRPRMTTYVDGSQTLLEYDADDNVVLGRDSNGLQIRYTVDALGRQTRLDLELDDVNPQFPYPAAAETREVVAYDGVGRIVRLENDWCTVTRAVDSMGRRYQETMQMTTPFGPSPGPFTIGRSYDAIGNCTGITYPAGRILRYVYDGVNRLVAVEQLSQGASYPGSATFGAQYDLATYSYRGLRLRRASYANQASRELRYDGAARTIGVQHSGSTGALLLVQQLFDGAGNLRVRLEQDDATTVHRTHRYDSLNRLTKYEDAAGTPLDLSSFEPPEIPRAVQAMTGQVVIDQAIGSLAQSLTDYTYRYDAAGNRREERLPASPAVFYTVNTLNEYSSVDGATHRYDLNGNLVDDGQRTYRYNYRNQLTDVRDSAANSELLRLLYDGSGRLVALRASGAVTHFVLDGNSVIEEYAAGALSTQYVCEPGTDRRLQIAVNGGEWWYHCDALGSLRALSDPSGQAPVATRFTYDPFGRVIAGTSRVSPYQWMGKRLLLDNLYDSRARQYSAKLGRFLQRDPKHFSDGANLYTYCGNNPATFVDPMGFEKTAAEPGVTATPLTPEEQAAWNAAERAHFDSDSVHKLMSVFAEKPGTQEGITQNVMERYATVRGQAFSVNWDDGNYASASGHLLAGMIESFGAPLGGKNTSETIFNGIVAALVARFLGGLWRAAKTQYTGLINRAPYASPIPQDIVIRPSPQTPLDREGAAVWADILSEEWAEVLAQNLSRNMRPVTAGVSIDVTTGQVRWGTSGEGRGGFLNSPPGQNLLPHPGTPVLPQSLVTGNFGPIPVNRCTEFALQDKARWAGAFLNNQIMSVRNIDPKTNVHALRRACWNCQVTSHGAHFTAGLEPPPH